MEKTLRLLLVEDSEDDALLLLRHLKQSGYELSRVARVQTAEALRHELRTDSWDIVIADYAMPELTGLAALDIVQKERMDIPFILVSGTIGELVAVEAMKAGAQDYLMKDNLIRLVPAIERALEDSKAVRRAHHAESALRASEARFRQLVENAGDAIFVIDRDGTILSANHQACASLGYTPDELQCKNIMDIDKALQQLDHWWQLAAEDSSAPLTLRSQHYRHNEYPFPVENRIAMIDIEGQQHMMVLARDMTEHEKFQEALQLVNEQLEALVTERTEQLQISIEQLQVILRNSNDAIALTNANGDIASKNPAFERFFGVSVHAQVNDMLKVLADPADSNMLSLALRNVLQDGLPARVEARLFVQGGSEIDADIMMSSVVDKNGAISGMVLSLRDITALKDVDRVKDRFVADAAHDLANPIANLKLHLYAAQMTKDPERVERHMKALKGQVDRLANLVADLRTLSQVDRGKSEFTMQATTLPDILENVIFAHEPVAASKNQELIYKPCTNPQTIWVDPDKIERVAVNLIANALNYTPDGGRVEVCTQCRDHHVVLTIKDSGMGISDEALPNIFERFFRADEAQVSAVQGTGLGLAIVKEIVDGHNGSISVESEAGKGSTFTVILPTHTEL